MAIVTSDLTRPCPSSAASRALHTPEGKEGAVQLAVDLGLVAAEGEEIVAAEEGGAVLLRLGVVGREAGQLGPLARQQLRSQGIQLGSQGALRGLDLALQGATSAAWRRRGQPWPGARPGAHH